MKASELRAKRTTSPASRRRSAICSRPFRPAHAEGHQQLNNHSQLGKTRRDIARAKTILAEKKGLRKRAKSRPNKRRTPAP